MSRSPEETVRLGERLAGFLSAGSVVLFDGGLGAGKTTLTKGLARGLGVEETITSPTYTIISEYRGRLALFHIDLYRIEEPQEFENLGLRDILAGGGVCVVEWSGRLPGDYTRDALNISIECGKDGERVIEISGLPPGAVV